MAPTLDYYFSLISPFTYLGHQAFLDVAAKHGAQVNFKPFNLPDVFKTSGVLPIPERPASRQSYRLIELQRIADFRGLPLTLRPKHFPTNPGPANGIAAAFAADGGDPGAFMFDVFQAIWAHDQDIADEAVLRTVMDKHGMDGDALLAAAGSAATLATLDANTQEAIAAGAVGAPAYILNGEPFWGQDRVEHLDHALGSARGPFSAQ